MENTRLSLADFKAKADKVETSDVLEKIQGGSFSDCHGWWGALGKSMDLEIKYGFSTAPAPTQNSSQVSALRSL